MNSQEFHSIWRHKKTGGLYTIVAEALIEATMTPAVVYRSIRDTNTTWIRPYTEFMDGRFEIAWPKT